jgi:hypothetical protein
LRKQSNEYIFAFVGVPSSPAVVVCFPPTTRAKAIERIYFICNYLIIRHKLFFRLLVENTNKGGTDGKISLKFISRKLTDCFTMFAMTGLDYFCLCWCSKLARRRLVFSPTTLAKAIERICFICNYLIIRRKDVLPIVGGKHQQRQKFNY